MGSFTFSVPAGADKKKLEALIEAQLMFERMNEARLFLVHLLAIVGAPLWLCLWLVPSLPQSTRSFLLALWSVCGLITLAVSILQWVWYRRRIHRLADCKATSQEGTG
jgi:hypothetical protein